MTSPVDIRPDHLEIVQGILREHLPVDVKVWVFGSRTNWTTKDSSDLDLALDGESKLNHKLLGALKDAFEDSTLPYTVDVVDLNAVSHAFKQIVKEQRVALPLVRAPGRVDGAWREVTLGDVAELVMGQSPPGAKVSGDNGLALLNGPTEFGASHPTPVQFTTDARKYAQPGDILFCVRGSTTGRMNWADQEYAIGRGVAAIRHKYDSALQPFVRGVIELGLPELLAQATGSTFPNVSAQQLAEIPYPSLDEDEQRAIAHILGTVDDKIELNRRMNETLEAMARALFKSWFVDFEPVRAKMEGRWRRGESLPGLPADLYDLFPDRLVDSELGEIPEGWRVRALGAMVEQLQDNENPQASPNTTFSHFSIPAFDQGKVPIQEYGSDIKSAKTRLQRSVVLVSKLNPEIERVWLVDIEADERAVCSTEFLVLHARPPFQRSYVYCLARSPLFRQQVESLVTGTSKSHQRAQANAVLSVRVIYPSEPAVHAFGQQAAPLLDGVLAYRKEAIILAAQRDALLPRLVSGEVGVENHNVTPQDAAR